MSASIELTKDEAIFLVAILQADRQTALQLLAAEQFYKPHLLPKLEKAMRALKRSN